MTANLKKSVYQIGYATTCGLLFLTFLCSVIFYSGRGHSIYAEGGWVEGATVFAYFLCAALIVFKRQTRSLFRFFVVILFFMLRELDFDKRFTTMGIFKGRLYFSEEVPFYEKIIGLVVISILVYLLISITRQYYKCFLEGLKKRLDISVGMLLILGFLAVSKTLDGAPRKLKDLGLWVSDHLDFYLEAVEELLELGIPLLILLTLSAWFSSNRPRTLLSESDAPASN